MHCLPSTPLTYSHIFKLSVPVMLAQAAIAATGVADTLVMGFYGDKTDLAAVAIASVVFGFVYWGFGFLRMSTTGLTAQAMGRTEPHTAQAVLQRGMLLGALLGGIVLCASPVLRPVVFVPFGADSDVNTLSKAYFDTRIWGAPALLVQYAITGWLLGMGRTGSLLLLQIIMNGINIVLDVWFVVGLGWGPAGIGAGTAIAEWSAMGVGLLLISPGLRAQPNLLQRQALVEMFSANRDILIRTLALLLAFVWFVRSGAQMGTAYLAGNEVLLQFITVAAFILDGFAFVAEKEVGEAYGSHQRTRLIRAMRVTTELAIVFGVIISLLYYLSGSAILNATISDPDARRVALAYLPYCALVPIIGVAAYQLDGFFLGATQGPALRTAAVVTTALYIGLDLLLRPAFGNSGVWFAFILMFVIRALALGWYLPALIRRTSSEWQSD